MRRIYQKYVHSENSGAKLTRIKTLRELHKRHETVDIELIFDWLSENGLPGDLNARCIDVFAWALSNDCSVVLKRARARKDVFDRFTKTEAPSTELDSENDRARFEQSRKLALFKAEYRTEEERRVKIASELSLIRLELGKPELIETDDVIAYAIARICERIALGLPAIAKLCVG